VSATFVKDLDYLKEIIESSFRKCAVHIGYARKWIEIFLDENIEYKIIISEHQSHTTSGCHEPFDT